MVFAVAAGIPLARAVAASGLTPLLAAA
jgi:hypothetical protein